MSDLDFSDGFETDLPDLDAVDLGTVPGLDFLPDSTEPFAGNVETEFVATDFLYEERVIVETASEGTAISLPDPFTVAATATTGLARLGRWAARRRRKPPSPDAPGPRP